MIFLIKIVFLLNILSKIFIKPIFLKFSIIKKFINIKFIKNYKLLIFYLANKNFFYIFEFILKEKLKIRIDYFLLI